jgi:3-oxoacyl-[acyl-carrier-protein] synthase-3
MTKTPIGIRGVGMYVPPTVITAAEITHETGIPEAVIVTKFGLRHKPVPGPDDQPTTMALRAAQAALAQADVAPDEIDVLLCTTEEWKEYPVWTAGIKLAYDLGARRAWALDVQMRCSTTIGAIKLAEGLMAADPAVNTVLIAGGYRNGDLVDYANPRTRFMINLSAGAGALLLRKNHPHNQILSTALMVDGSFSLDVIIPVGGTMAPLTAATLAARQGAPWARLDVPDPEGMKERLDALSMQNFLRVIDTALAESGHSRADIDYLNILHMKRSAHNYVLQELGLREDQTYYLSDFGHVGQQDQMISIIKGLETGRLRDGDLMVMVAAGVGYAWGASVVQWGSS